MIISTNENIFHFFILSAATLPNHNILTISQYYLKDILRTKKEKKTRKGNNFFRYTNTIRSTVHRLANSEKKKLLMNI